MSLQPRFLVDAFGPRQGGVYFAGVGSTYGTGTVLQDDSVSVPVAKTIFAVFRDDGSIDGCCNSVVFFGISSDYYVWNAQGITTSNPGMRPCLDYAGFTECAYNTVAGLPTLVAGMYGPAGSSLRVNGGVLFNFGRGGVAAHGGMLGSRNNQLTRFFKGLIGEVIVFSRELSAAEAESVQAYLFTAWPVLVRDT